jgi:antibiotic biosynthesis monooxygenase (ABM) superfamily enzyme
MDHQLRIYRLKPGRMDEFLALWRESVVPARQAAGFEVVSAYVNRETDEFVWVVRYAGDGDLAAGDERYYASPERAALPWDPREALDTVEVRLLEPYSP